MRKVLVEGLLVAVLGALLAFAANALSPRGLKLTRDFFPATSVPSTNLPAATNLAATRGTNSPSPLELLAARLQAKGLRLADSNQVVRLFNDPRRDLGLVLFIDSRHDEQYHAGHIPGAYQLDYYYPSNYFPTVLPLCQIAEEIVVYCHGGTCEDSELTATFLLSAGIPKEKLFVYGGGMTEWETNGLPVELSVRQSGQFRKPSAAPNSAVPPR